MWPKMCIDVKNVHTKEDLQKYIASEVMGKPIDIFNLPPIRYFLISDY